jgi:hypothetical protein
MFVAWHALALRVPPAFSVRMFIIKGISGAGTTTRRRKRNEQEINLKRISRKENNVR